MFVKKLIFLLMTSALLFTCSSGGDNSDDMQDDDDGNQEIVVTANVNGDEFEVPFENAIVDLSYAFFSNQLRFICVTDTEFMIDNEAITITVFFDDIDDLVEGVEWDSAELDFVNTSIRGIYQAQDDASGEAVNSTTDDTLNAYLKITSLDMDTMLISGEFNFVAQDEVDGELKTYTISNGVFTDVKFQDDTE